MQRKRRQSESKYLPVDNGIFRVRIANRGQGPLAQLVEQGTFNPKVGGSSPPGPTIVWPGQSLVGWPFCWSDQHRGLHFTNKAFRALVGFRAGNGFGGASAPVENPTALALAVVENSGVGALVSPETGLSPAQVARGMAELRGRGVIEPVEVEGPDGRLLVDFL